MIAATHVTPHVPIVVSWMGGAGFDASRECGPLIHIDGDAKQAPSPVDVLLASLAACAATDVVTILEKQRTPPARLQVRVESTRVNETPRRLASVVLHFSITGQGVRLCAAKPWLASREWHHCHDDAQTFH